MSGNDVGAQMNTYITLMAWGEDDAVGGELYFQRECVSNFMEGLGGVYGCGYGGGFWSKPVRGKFGNVWRRCRKSRYPLHTNTMPLSPTDQAAMYSRQWA
jgi:hypothetical protein